MNSSDFKNIFANLCCSKCRNDFEIEDLKIIERQGGLMICNLVCQKCGKDFGKVIFNYNQSVAYHSPLKVIEGPPPIDADDVIDAHIFIKNNL